MWRWKNTSWGWVGLGGGGSCLHDVKGSYVSHGSLAYLQMYNKSQRIEQGKVKLTFVKCDTW